MSHKEELCHRRYVRERLHILDQNDRIVLFPFRSLRNQSHNVALLLF